ncbi:MAG TPA: hypothetical protein VHW24_23055, partial [Bryobacteraceae bacterium]|nr:hypothetical protein [Bryobacteraceae bacterium]
MKKISQRTEFQVYPPRRATRPWGVIALSCMALFTVILYLYWPALNGHFIFDDTAFPFCTPVRHSPLAKWISTVGVRPVLVVSYWLNYHFWGESPFSFHFANVVIHFVNSALVFLVLRRLLQKAGWAGRKPQLASAVGALIFAIHPLQTESVSYVAGRSESLASFFLLLAYAIFLYRRQEAISWGESLLVLALFAMGVKTKENAVSLAPVLLLTDLFWPVAFSLRGVKRNWRLYGLMIPGVAVAGVLVFRMLAAAHSAGFSAASFKWYQYAFTEARAIFAYIRMAIWPAGLSLDHDFATSHTIWENGALWWILL